MTAKIDVRDYTEAPLPEPAAISFTVDTKKADVMKADAYSNGIFYVVSDKIHSAIAGLNPQKFQMVPAELVCEKKLKADGSWYYLNPYNRIKCLNMDESVYDYDDFADEVEDIEKMVLDSEKLASIPLAERLIFSLGELYTFRLFHKSVVDAIMAVNPEGIKFTSVANWDTGAAFS